MKKKPLINFLLFSVLCAVNAQTPPDGYQLVFSDEFNKGTKPDTTVWNYEHGFVRNEEHQWYQPENAFIKKGKLIIEGRKETIRNPKFNPDSKSWKHKREYAQYSSASVNTAGKKTFLYGRFEIRAKIDTAMGLWPAIWTLGVDKRWPNCGEIDIMEYYPINGEHHILANVLSVEGMHDKQKWQSNKIHFNHFLEKDKHWPDKFHIWRMDWDKEAIHIYLDDELINETLLSSTYSKDGFNPFHQPHYILLNLALGGQNGGDLTHTRFPTRYCIDYVRVYQKR